MSTQPTGAAVGAPDVKRVSYWHFAGRDAASIIDLGLNGSDTSVLHTEHWLAPSRTHGLPSLPCFAFSCLA